MIKPLDNKLPLLDLQRYYGGCFVRKLEADGHSMWVYLASVAELDKEIQIHYYDERREEHSAFIKRSKWDVCWPECKYYFFRGQALLLSKRPIRAGHKGAHSENSRFINPLTQVVPANFHKGLLSIVEFNEYLEAFNRGQINQSIPRSIELLQRGGCISVPVKDDWALSISPYPNGKYVLFKGPAPCAGVNEKAEIQIIEPYYAQEVEDSFLKGGNRAV